MSTILATRDSQARTSVKTGAGVTTHLPSHQASTQFIPTVETVRAFSANSTGTWGTYSEFVLTVDQLPHILDTLTLVLSLGAATQTGGTAIGFVNDAAFLSRLIEVSVGSELLSSIYPEGQYMRHVLHMTTEEKLLTLVVAGNDTLAHRRTRAAAGQTLMINLHVPFIGKYGWFTGQQGAQLRIRVYHAALSDVVVCDGTAPACSINSIMLNAAGRNYLSQSSVGALVTTQRKLGHVDERFLDNVNQQFTLVSGSASYTLQLTNLMGLCDHLLFVVRTAAAVGTPNGNTQDSFLAVQNYSFTDGAGNVVLPSTPSAYALGPYTAKFINSDARDNNDSAQKNIYPIWFGSRPDEAMAKGSNHGFYKMSGVDKITVTFASAISANYVLDVVGYIWSQVSADAHGVVKKSLIV